MNTPPHIVRGLLFLPCLLVAVWAEQPAPKTVTLFMGVDLAVQRDANFYRVVDVNGSELQIRIGRKEFFVPTRGRLTGLKVDYGLKLAQATVTLDGLESGPTYTPANDPRRKFEARAGAESGAQAARGWSEARQSEAQASLVAAQGGSKEFQKNYEDIIEQEQANQGVLNQQLGSDYYSIPKLADDLALELAQGNYDAMEVSFKISSPVELENPYMVILFKYRERDAKEDDVGMLIHAKQLEPIGPKPRYIRVREGGLPVGFKYVDCSVHIYNRGTEVATNLSSKRVELSREEAQQYLVIEHMGAHKQGTVPASVVRGGLSAAVRGRLTAEKLERTCYVKVSKDGTLLGVFADEGCAQPLEDADTIGVLADSFFRPALVEGKPVDGVARVRLVDLAL